VWIYFHGFKPFLALVAAHGRALGDVIVECEFWLVCARLADACSKVVLESAYLARLAERTRKTAKAFGLSGRPVTPVSSKGIIRPVDRINQLVK